MTRPVIWAMGHEYDSLSGGDPVSRREGGTGVGESVERVGEGSDPILPHRDVRRHAGAWHFKCHACGYWSRKQDFQYQAVAMACPVCLVLAESHERERKAYGE